ncbi:hypothetical protein RHSIM_Rhsim09G0163600 [Rhododendron simsii]|uniref:Uncharacterized protein n=1 Tax=Rhododendron simsii TaxID=118357 RepID=A0A834GH15_RHOSS|nr:hypothetical protein RHSIM_Rhsim09G0163600 [Rhododendron simsii]
MATITTVKGLEQIDYASKSPREGWVFATFMLLILLSWPSKVGGYFEGLALFQQLFKGKYFHNLSFWDAPCPNTASWAWRSIVVGRTILKKGWRWSVGDGSSIDIWKDPWLPRSLSFKILSPPPLADSLFYNINRVANLIDVETLCYLRTMGGQMIWKLFLSLSVGLPGKPGMICFSTARAGQRPIFWRRPWICAPIFV